MVSFIILLLLGVFSFFNAFMMEPTMVTHQTIQYLAYVIGAIFISGAFISLQSWLNKEATVEKLNSVISKMDSINKKINDMSDSE